MGRHKVYASDEERKQVQREHALKYYYRRKALKQALEQGNNSEGVITVSVNDFSKKLGKIEENIQFKTKSDNKLLKKRDSVQK